MICIAMRAARGYHVVLYRATRLIRREAGVSGVIMAPSAVATALEALFSEVAWYRDTMEG